MARQMRDSFLQQAGQGRQLRGDFFNGPGRAGKWEGIYPTGRAGPANER